MGQGKIEVIWRTPVPARLWPSQIPHQLAWNNGGRPVANIIWRQLHAPAACLTVKDRPVIAVWGRWDHKEECHAENYKSFFQSSWSALWPADDIGTDVCCRAYLLAKCSAVCRLSGVLEIRRNIWGSLVRVINLQSSYFTVCPYGG